MDSNTNANILQIKIFFSDIDFFESNVSTFVFDPNFFIFEFAPSDVY